MAGEGRFRVTELSVQVQNGTLMVGCGVTGIQDEAGEFKCTQNTAQAFDMDLSAANLEVLRKELQKALDALPKKSEGGGARP